MKFFSLEVIDFLNLTPLHGVIAILPKDIAFLNALCKVPFIHLINELLICTSLLKPM
jgi:hypothetical protein